MSGKSSLPITHLLVWLGDDSATKINWSSEREGGALQRDVASFRVRVPQSALADCANCKLMVQAVNLSPEKNGVASISEGRYVVQREVW